MALEGDAVAMRLVLERIIPPRRGSAIRCSLPVSDDIAGVAAAQKAVLEAVTTGDITLTEAQQLNGLLEAKRDTLMVTDLEARLRRLEGRNQ
jgi:hypothetical protein